jgi:serine/threonine protein kinase
VFVLDGSSQQRNKNVTETIFLEKLQGTRAVPRLIANWSCACEKLPNLVQNKLLQHKGIQSKKICRYILMEYCDGDLHSLLETEPANRHLNFFAGMTALAQIGKAKCLHNDISFRHIMYQGIKLVERKFVVVDFGYAQEIIPNKAKRYYANVYANIPTSYVYDYDPLLNKWFAEDSYAQLFAIFHNLFPLLIEFRKDRYRKMSFPREGKDYYFNGFVLDVYAEPVRQWTNAVNLLNADKPLLIVEDFGHSENNSFRIKFSKFLEAASFVAEI